MQSVKVSRADLLDKVLSNRAEHRATFLKAQEKFREAVIERLDRMLADARDGKKVSQYVGLTAPQDHTRDYDRVVAMLEMSKDETISLSAQEFESYVMDRWTWARQFGQTVSSYGVNNKYDVSDPEEE